MAQMQALLKIKADVEGEGKIASLNRAIGGLSSTAGKVSGGLRGLAGAAGGLSGALGSLGPLATGAGLAAMAKGAIDAADDMNDLSQKTGVSVESLSKFQQAGNASGTSIEGVGAAMIKLNRNLATGNAGATEALTSLGISATDASGKLKSTDAIMLEVANKFAKMPDGAGKTAAAMALFGKAGADMIPMLNGGSKAITDLSATMTGEFARGADSLNDKLAALQGKLLALGVNIGTALMPALNVIADLVMGLANAFAAMPGPLQAIIGGAVALAAAFVVLAPAISAIISIAGVLAGLKIGATIAGWAALAGPAITAISAAFTGLLTFLTGTLLPGLIAFFSGPVGWTVLAVAAVVAMVVLFREPIMQFLVWLGQTISTAFSGLMAKLQPIFVQPFIDLWNNVLRGPVTAMFSWIGGYIQASMQTAYALAYAVFVLPFIALWDNVLRGPVTAFVSWLQGAWSGIASYFNNNVIAPIGNAWNTLATLLAQTANTISTNVSKAWGSIAKFFVDNVTTPISKAWTTMTEFLPKAMNTIGDKVKSIFTGVVKTIKSALRSVLQFIANAVNRVGAEVNKLIRAFNRLPGPDIPFVRELSIPQFAKGGVVTGPTLAVVGEGGEPEYIIPQSKMAAASANYLNGARGGAVIPAFANGGYVSALGSLSKFYSEPGSANRPAVTGTRIRAQETDARIDKFFKSIIDGSINNRQAPSNNNTQINITTGPVVEWNGKKYVTMNDMEKAMRKTADGVYASLRTPAGRYALGTR